VPAERRRLQIEHGALVRRLLRGCGGSAEGFGGLGVAPELMEGDSAAVVRLVPRWSKHNSRVSAQGLSEVAKARVRR
jgi:hypothetical protein